MVTIKDGCGCDPCSCDWKQKLKEAYSRAIQSVNKIGDETGRVYFPDGTGFVKMPLPTKEQIDSIAEIDGIKASVDELNKTVPALETQVAGVTESLVSGVKVLNGTTAGKFKVRIERKKASLIDSNDYDLSKVNSVELIQGSGPAMVKAQLTLSDGTILRSDDFVFTTEAIGTDVYISSFVFKNGNVAGTISADIGLNNGTTLEANNFLVPTDPNVISSITDLQTRTEALEQNVIDINNKADLDNVNQTIVAKQIDLESTVRIESQNKSAKFGIIANTSNNPFNVTEEVESFGQLVDKPIGSIAMLDANGNPMNFTAGVGGIANIGPICVISETTPSGSYRATFKPRFTGYGIIITGNTLYNNVTDLENTSISSSPILLGESFSTLVTSPSFFEPVLKNIGIDALPNNTYEITICSAFIQSNIIHTLGTDSIGNVVLNVSVNNGVININSVVSNGGYLFKPNKAKYMMFALKSITISP